MVFNFINVNMIVILILSLITVANCLKPKSDNEINDDINSIFSKYLKKVPDIESRYVINDKLSSVINHYFKGKISSLPLFKISLKIDRNPVKIPWTLDTPEMQKVDTAGQRYKSAEQDNTDKHVRQYKVVKLSAAKSTIEKVDATTLSSTYEEQTITTPTPEGSQ